MKLRCVILDDYQQVALTSATELKRMRPSAYLINTSRASIVAKLASESRVREIRMHGLTGSPRE
ncbi:hypothetical protein [Paenibacillus sp. V4I7]|uniref:hypothetical protein n=1 Tax=Paenibacillus sp. V4I7 TaxID=3042307 RepID=UPI0027822211|nr:hypothetical protein [Paenibacillus sp. V4I7]MDQ0899022.1 phosphoglycerate dehydrogenase-like enzyme [Paenibacillus sp. V4I7]